VLARSRREHDGDWLTALGQKSSQKATKEVLLDMRRVRT
jgi:hypothetical protein